MSSSVTALCNYDSTPIYLHSSRRNTRSERTTPGGESRGVKSTVAIAHENGVEERERPCTVEAATLQGTVRDQLRSATARETDRDHETQATEPRDP